MQFSANTDTMAQIRSPLPVKLFVGVLTSLPQVLPKIEERLANLLGPIDTRSESFPFDFTNYYDEEMGTPICRIFFSFAELIDPAEIGRIKEKTNALESEFAARYSEVRRPVNLDPGYLEQSKIVLASTKNFFHRILVSGGIYAEVTLHYQNRGWQSFPWTFPDYKSGRYHEFFTALRILYREQLKAAGFRIRL
jgi:hypothetical protein